MKNVSGPSALDGAYDFDDMSNYDIDISSRQTPSAKDHHSDTMNDGASEYKAKKGLSFVVAKRAVATIEEFPRLYVPPTFNCMHRPGSIPRGLLGEQLAGLTLTEDILPFADIYQTAKLGITPDHRMVRLTGAAADQRGALLGARQLKAGPKAPLPPPATPPPSNKEGGVFGMMSEADRKKLADSFMASFRTANQDGGPTEDWASALESKFNAEHSNDHLAQKRFKIFLTYHQKKGLVGESGLTSSYMDLVNEARSAGTLTTWQRLRV